MSRKLLSLSLSLLLILSLFSTGSALDVKYLEAIDREVPMVNVIVQLDQRPVLAYEVELKNKGKFNLNNINAYANQLNIAIDSVINMAKKSGLDIVTNYQYKYSFAGFSATVPINQVNELFKIPGVKNVFPDTIIEVPKVQGTVPKTGAPYLWDLPENITGEGMIIAILDTGIDYNHVLLGGGFGEGYKVMGGYNFTDSGSPLNPIDVQGHGTHVAGIAAGKGFGYDGVAPDANLYAVKVLGDDGSGMSSWVIAGIEWAVNPHNGLPRADVINMSLGNTIISPNFPTSLAANQAAEAGVIVVSSAGNSGHDRPTAGSPGTGDKVISVGSYGLTEPAILSFSNGVIIDNGIVPAADAPKPDGEQYEIVYAGLARGEDFEGLDVNGKIVLAQRGAITFAAKGANAKANGAVGIIVFNNVPGTFGMAGTFEIPAFAVSLEVGLEILEMIENEEQLKVAMATLDPMDLMANSSSGGPTSKYTLKPDISAPGVGVTSAYPGNSLASLSGTSMAAPHVAGGVALLKQLKPGLEVEEYKALLMNTPTWLYDMYGNKYPVTVKGAGAMNLEAAAKSRGIAVPGSLSLNVTGSTNTIRVVNTSDEEITYNVEFISDSLTATFVEQITVEGNSEVTFEVEFYLNVVEGPHEGYIILTPTEPLEVSEDDEEPYFDKLQVTVYYYSGDIKEFFVRDLEFERKFTNTDKIDITFTLLKDTEWIAVVIYDKKGNLIDTVAEAPLGLPKGTWTMYNTSLGLPDGEYVLRLYAISKDDEVHDLWEPFEINSTPARPSVEYQPYTNQDKYLLKGELDRQAVVKINDVVVPVCSDLKFQHEVEIKEGVNEFKITTTTPFGAMSELKIVIEKIEDFDVFSVDQLIEKLQFTAYEQIFVYEYLSPGAVVKVSVNNGSEVKYIADENGLLKYNIELEKGLNTIRFTQSFNNIIYTYNVEIYRRTVDRLAGSNRFETATAISRHGWEKSDTVILARSDDFADSLTAIPLSKKLDAPILLTKTEKLNEETKAEILRLEAKEVIILGGTAAISEEVKKELEELELSVRRISGSNRFETAAAIAREIIKEDTAVENVIIVSGRNFPDGLSATMLLNKLNAPILLVESDRIPTATKEFIVEFNVENVYIIGGSAVVSNEVVEELPNPVRIAGSNRYATSVEVAKEVASDLVFIANGESFADSITLATLVAKYDGILLLVNEAVIPNVVMDYIQEIAEGVLHFYIAGGNAAVSQVIEEELLSLLKKVEFVTK